jgi:hypothetical protein
MTAIPRLKAVDYCVLQTVLDARREGLVTVYLQEFQPRSRPQSSAGDQAATGGE